MSGPHQALQQAPWQSPPPESPRVVALGGGHGLAASLRALSSITPQLTAVVTVADNGGSSGRLRAELDVLPPGDLRMALAALCGQDDWGDTWARVLQHRFGAGELAGHAVGNLLIVALWELLSAEGAGPPDGLVDGLDLVGRLLRARGRVLPMATTPLDIVAEVRRPGGEPESGLVRGQVQVATCEEEILSVMLEPAHPSACPEAVSAIEAADWVVLGPGSWFTSVIPHLLVPSLREALIGTSARILVSLNLVDQPGETQGMSPAGHVATLLRHAPGIEVEGFLADRAWAADEELTGVIAEAGARLFTADLARSEAPDQHDPQKLAVAYARVMRPA